jgi:glutaredoxin
MSLIREAKAARPDISVYWVPACSSCIKAKEFVASLGEPFESLNILEHPDALAEVAAAGIRGAPAVRKGDKIIHAQSLDDLAAFFGRSRPDQRLPREVLVARWDTLQDKVREVIASFPESELEGHTLVGPHANVLELAEHAYQIVESFLRLIEDDTIDARAIYLRPDKSMRSMAGLLAYADRIRTEYGAWLEGGGPSSIPARLNTHYGNQPADVVLERYVWHMAQHVRQLDHLAAGEDEGGPRHIPAALYEGLPLPKGLWS